MILREGRELPGFIRRAGTVGEPMVVLIGGRPSLATNLPAAIEPYGRTHTAAKDVMAVNYLHWTTFYDGRPAYYDIFRPDVFCDSVYRGNRCRNTEFSMSG